MLRQKEVIQYGQWLKAPSPPRRHDRGSGRNESKRETSSNYYQKREGAPPSTAAEGGYTKMAAGRWDETISNPRRLRVSKERSEETGVDQGGGSHESFLFKSQAATDDLLAGGRKERKGINVQREGKKPIKESHSKYGDYYQPTSSKRGKFSSTLKEKVAHGDLEKEKGMTINGVHVEEVFTDGLNSPDPRRDKFNFSGPLLADVEKTMKAEKGLSTERNEIQNGICGGKVTSWKRKEREEQEEVGELTILAHEARKKRDRNGGKNITGENLENTPTKNLESIENGSGLAEAVEQPRRPI
jgi:hypothetical protein